MKIIGLDDESNEEIVPKKKGGRKPAAAGVKKRGPAAKKAQDQKLITEMLKPVENAGISLKKKVRKIRASPFNKKSDSILGKAATNKEIEETSGLDNLEDSMEMAARARPKRATRVQAKYVVSDSDTEENEDDEPIKLSDTEDDDFSEDE